MYHTFSYILSLSLYSYHTKLPKLFHVLHFCVCMNDTTQKFCCCFSDLSIHVQSLRFQWEKSLPRFSKLHKVMTFVVAYFQEAIKILMLTSTDPKRIFNDILILKFPDIYKCTHYKLESLCIFMKLACFPVYSKKCFLMANQAHSYITRNSNNLYIISCPNKYKTFWYKISGSKMFQFTKCCYYLSF